MQIYMVHNHFHFRNFPSALIIIYLEEFIYSNYQNGANILKIA